MSQPSSTAFSPFQGSICALVTPFLSDFSIDWDAYKRLIEAQIQGGTDALVIAGSTGESTALEIEEFRQLIIVAKQQAAGRIRIIAGTGTPSTAKSIQLCEIAALAGAEGVLVVAPAYCRPTQQGLYLHFKAIADASKIPVLLYNVPTRTAVDLLPETVARLHQHPNICGIKEALNDMKRIRELVKLQTAQFLVLSGDDPTAAEAIALGALGLISVAANSHPRQIKKLVSNALTGRVVETDLQLLFDALALEPNPIPVKWALAQMGLCQALLRLPLTELSGAHHAKMRAVLANYQTLTAQAA